MTSPISYNRLVRFLDYATSHTSATYNASDHDAELDAVQTSIASLITNLALIQRTDGALKNASVHADAFSTASKALIGAGSTGNLNWTPKGLWVTLTVYALGNVVQNSTTSYVCAVAHTAGVFATDYAAGKWIILGETFTGAASSISFTPYSHIAATNVQAAIQEVVDEKALLAGSAGQAFSIADSTTATQAASVGQVQKGNLTSIIGAGTSDAITGTLTSSLTTLTDGQGVEVEATAANGTTAPTFQLTYSVGPTATPAKTIKKGNAQPLLAGDIPGAGFKMQLVYSLLSDCWLILNPAFQVGQSAATLEADAVQNVGISFSVGTNALTAALKTASLGVPSSADQVKVAVRSSSLGTGQYLTRSATQATQLTVSSGSTLGHSSNVASDMHWYLIDNGGLLELAVSTKFYGYSGIVTTVAEGGTGTATSATTMYSTSARTSVPFTWFCATRDTQTVAGTWSATPSTVDLVRAPSNANGTPAGVVMDFAGTTVPNGWLECDASAISRTTFANLFTAIGTTWGVGDGSTTFNLPPSAGRSRIGRGTGTVAETVAFGSVSTGSDNFTVASNNTKWITGQPVILTTTGGLPAGLALLTTYFLVRSSATLIQFATTLANAQNGTVIDLTTQGTGNHTVTGTLTARTIGEQGGEENHAISVTELLLHTHSMTSPANIANFATGSVATHITDSGTSIFQTPGVNSSTGGNAAMNNMSPFAVFMAIIKT